MTQSATPPLSRPPSFDTLVQSDIARQLKRAHPMQLAGNVLMVTVTLIGLGKLVALPLVLAWTTLQALTTGFSAWAAWRQWRRPTRPENAARRLRLSVRASLVLGLQWMVGLLLFFPPADYGHRAMLVVFVGGMVSAGMLAFSVHLPALLAFFIPCATGLLLAVLTSGSEARFGVAALLVGWAVAAMMFSRQLHQTVIQSLYNRHAADALAAALQLERDRAIELSQARSRFLAAASHDLRQPVHALALFVGALQQQPPAAEAQRLLGHVHNTVESLGSMFNALLDLSKLDAEVLTPAMTAIDLRQLLARLATEVGALAAAKGLQMRSDPKYAAALTVHSDPLLLERILRNLLSNALRYTERGEVRLQAVQRGTAVRIRVADTGIGIAREHVAEVFKEFVQLHNPERDRQQGLGLGLAIVKRLSELLGHRLTLRSRPGRGSVVSLWLPLAAAATDPAAEPGPTRAEASAAAELLNGDLVLLVDDNADIRFALTALLSAWGCHVLAAPGLAALRPQLLSLTVRPRLLICDFRLRDQENGLDVIAQLREDFNCCLPAVLLTGDTAPDRLREALAADVPLLHKPVGPAALRGAIARVLAQADRDD